MKIIDLLKDENRTVMIQGHHTRMLLSGDLFEVFSRPSSSKSSFYREKKYEGYDEEEAVAAFVKSEDK
jgi:hypothetical protein